MQKASYPGSVIIGAFSFSIGNKGYVGCGYDSSFTFYNDFWEYHPLTNAWTQKASFGGVARYAASGFSIGNKGYVGVGGVNGSGFTQEFWEYDPSINMWTQKSDFGGGARDYAVGFSIGNMGYIGTGVSNSFYNDLWQYNPITDTWSQKMNLPSTARGHANSFVIANNAYICGGSYNFPEVWEYNGITNTWSQKANYPGPPRSIAAAFTICDKGYFGTGVQGSNTFTDFMEYNPTSDTWMQKANYIGNQAVLPVFFSIGNKGYLGVGNWQNPTNQFYEYIPDSICSIPTGTNELTISNFSIYPNPPNGAFTISGLPSNKNVEIKIFDTKGKTVFAKYYQTTTSNIKLPVANISTGIYFVQVSDAENKVVRKMVVEQNLVCHSLGHTELVSASFTVQNPSREMLKQVQHDDTSHDKILLNTKINFFMGGMLNQLFKENFKMRFKKFILLN